MQETPSRLWDSAEDYAILFARSPVPGQVKSRLCTHLTPEQACQLHRASTNDVLVLLDQALPGANKWLFLSEEPTVDLANCGFDIPAGFHIAVQEGNNLGERMDGAFRRAFGWGARRVVIFGSDSPTLRPEIVQNAFYRLCDYDVALGPTDDGGYYLIGCRRFQERLFQGVEWSTPRTFEETLANTMTLGLRVAVLERWFDLDEWKDVERLLAAARRRESLPAHLAAFLKDLPAGLLH